MTFALSCAATGAAFLAGMAIGLFEQRLRRRRPRPCFGFDPTYRPETACRLDEDEHPTFV